MEIRPLDSTTLADWNGLAADSPDSWFWHTPDWLAFVKAVGAPHFLADLSALIYIDRRPAAICPVIMEDRDGYRRFTYLGEFVPSPAFRRDLPEPMRAKALERYTGWLQEQALACDVAYTRVIVPTLAETSQGAPARAWNPLLRHGYLDISAAAQVLSLEPDLDTLWREVRKGHRSDVKRAAGRCAITVWDRETITDQTFEQYRTLHAIDAGRITRSPETFQIMLTWIRSGHAVLVEARQNGASAAFALIILFGSGAYYASSCRHPEVDAPAIHLVQWETIKWLQGRGYQSYDLGMQHFGPAWTYVPSPKDISIAAFKRGFGGSIRRVDVAERFYTTRVLEQVGRDRLQALIAARERQ